MTTQVMTVRTSFWRRLGVLWVLGLVGVIGVLPALLGQLSVLLTSNPAVAGIPLPVLAATALIQPLLVMTVSVAVGVALAHHLGLRSYVVEQVEGVGRIGPALRRDLPLALGVALFIALMIVGLDAAFAPWMPKAVDAVGAERSLGLTVTGVLYGGIVEELMLRWGLMTLFAWLLWRVFQRGEGRPSGLLMATAIILAAVVFSLGHLPAAATIFGSLTPMVIVRTVLLNSVAGLALGWLYWQRSLETAMLAHGASHILMTLVSLAAVALRGA